MKLQSILVPVDFSENSRQALAAAVEIHKLTSGRIRLLYVLEPLIVAFGEALPGDLPTDQERLLAAEAEMEKLRAGIELSAPVDTMVVEGTAWDVICDVADRTEADLIVIASHGYKGLRRFVLGSTAERVVRRAHGPVLVVKSKPPAGEEKKS